MKPRPAARGLGTLGLAGWLAITAVAAMPPASAWPQQIQFGDHSAEQTGASRKAHVVLLTEAVEVSAGTAQAVELRFRVEPGFHINSHTPKDELLLPTVLKLNPNEALRASVEQYPVGSAFRLEIGDGTTLDVYQNEFRLRVRMTAARGVSTLAGALHYQACDSSACFPPRTLPVKVLVTGK